MHHATRSTISIIGRRALPLLLLLPFLTGCEESLTDTNIVIPYEKELVVQGFLSEGSEVDTIWITRTLPPLERWTIEKAAITDADAVVTVDGVEHRLRHLAKGRYVLEGVTKVSGTSYALRVTADGLTATATATIPTPTEIEDLSADTVIDGCDFSEGPGGPGGVETTDAFEITATFRLREKTVYSAFAETIETSTYRNPDGEIDTFSYRSGGYPMFLFRDGAIDYDWTLYQRCLYDQGPGYTFRIDTVYVRLHTYEPAFTSYYETRWNGDDNDLLFGPSEGGPDWNVEGDGFGWFFGRAVDYDTLAAGD